MFGTGINPLKQRTYLFSEGSSGLLRSIGETGVNVCELLKENLPVPPGFIISEESCFEFYGQSNHQSLGSFLVEDCELSIAQLERETGKKFGVQSPSCGVNVGADGENGTAKNTLETRFPLLLTIRPKNAVAVYGDGEAIVGIGINDEVTDIMAQVSNNYFWALDTHRRFLQNYGSVVLGASVERYEEVLRKGRKLRGVDRNSALTASDLQGVIKAFKMIANVPSDPWEQLFIAIKFSFDAFVGGDGRYEDALVGAVRGLPLIVQTTVYGNMNSDSGYGKVSTRDPQTGEASLCGTFRPRALGRDRGGADTPVPIGEMRSTAALCGASNELADVAKLLERRYGDMQEIRYVMEGGQLSILESRNGRRTVPAAAKVLVSLVAEGRISEETALLRIKPNMISQFLQHTVETSEVRQGGDSMQCGPHSVMDGVASGVLVFSDDDIQRCSTESVPFVLCASKVHISGFHSAEGIIIAPDVTKIQRADMLRTASAQGKVCGVCRDQVAVDSARGTLGGKGTTGVAFHAGEKITVDGNANTVYRGEMQSVTTLNQADLRIIVGWADRHRRMGVQAFTYSFSDVLSILSLGADGVVICNVEAALLRVSPLTVEAAVACTPDARRAFCPGPVSVQHRELVDILRRMGGARTTFYLEYKLDLAAAYSRGTLRGEDENAQSVEPVTSAPAIKHIIGAIVEARQLGIPVDPLILVPDYNRHAVAAVIHSEIQEAQRGLSGAPLVDCSCEIGVKVETVRGCQDAAKLLCEGAPRIGCIAFCTDRITESFFQVKFDRDRDSDRVLRTSPEGTSVLAPNTASPLQESSVGDLIRSAITDCRRHRVSVLTIVTGHHCADTASARYFNWLSVGVMVCAPDAVPKVKIAAAQAEIHRRTGRKIQV